MLSAWAVLAAPLAAAFVITAPSAAQPLVAGQNNTIAWNATAPATNVRGLSADLHPPPVQVQC